ncbi:MAG: hypothetical protein MZW92_76930 [Comamonadaceae bacterium]|nr:hypothetical protein [Comamonadaceae bacterium]
MRRPAVEARLGRRCCCSGWCRRRSRRDVEIVVSEESGAYLELADALQRELRPHTMRRSVAAAGAARWREQRSAPDLVLAVGSPRPGGGTEGTQRADHRFPGPAPCLRAGVARGERIAEGRAGDRRLSGSALCTPVGSGPSLTLPERHRIGVLLGPEHRRG